MKEDFERVLEQSRELETIRLHQNPADMVREEFCLTMEIEHSLQEGTFSFPEAAQTEKNRRILIRTQNYFSAKVHLQEEGLYFHCHDFVELLYVYRGHCRQYLENMECAMDLQEGDLFLLNQNVIHGILQEDENAILIKIIIPVCSLKKCINRIILLVALLQVEHILLLKVLKEYFWLIRQNLLVLIH